MFRPSKRIRGMPSGGMYMGPQFGQMQQQPYYNQEQFSGPMDQQMMSNQSSLYPNMQFDRLLIEVNENRRRISNLNRRVTRLENYLRIRDNDDYDNNNDLNIPDEYSM